MAFDPNRFWQLSLLEVAAIATITISAAVIAAVAYPVLDDALAYALPTSEK